MATLTFPPKKLSVSDFGVRASPWQLPLFLESATIGPDSADKKQKAIRDSARIFIMSGKKNSHLGQRNKARGALDLKVMIEQRADQIICRIYASRTHFGMINKEK